MCGRFAQSIPLGKLHKIDLYNEMAGTYTEVYNRKTPLQYRSVMKKEFLNR